MNLPFQQLLEQTVFDGKWIKVDKNGESEILSVKGRSTAIIPIIYEDGIYKTVIRQEYTEAYANSFGGKVFTIPSGGAEDNENSLQCGLRELEEETGIIPVIYEVVKDYELPTHKHQIGKFNIIVLLIRQYDKVNPIGDGTFDEKISKSYTVTLEQMMSIEKGFDSLFLLALFILKSIVYQNLKEVTIKQLKNKGTPFTMRWRRERDRIRGPESRVANVVDTKRKKSDLWIYILTVPTYSNNSIELPMAKPSKTRKTNAYTIIIKAQKFFELAAQVIWKTGRKKINELKPGEFKAIMDKVQVQVFCSDPSFQWQGYNYYLSRKKASVYPTVIPAPIWGPRTGKGILGKHLIGVINSFNVFMPDIYQFVKHMNVRIIKKK